MIIPRMTIIDKKKLEKDPNHKHPILNGSPNQYGITVAKLLYWMIKLWVLLPITLGVFSDPSKVPQCTGYQLGQLRKPLWGNWVEA